MFWMTRRPLPSRFLSVHSVKTSSFSIVTPRCISQKNLFNSLLRRDNTRWSLLSQAPLHIRCLTLSTVLTKRKQQQRKLEVLEFSASNLNSCGGKDDRYGVLRTIQSSDTKTNRTWSTRETKTGNNSRLKNQLQEIPKKVISLLLPAQYPQSVARGYLGFVSFCFTASIAGSAAMVLSTQSLLLAVGIVGQSTSGGGVMAGALNWVMKDFMGQLGGIVFASQMGKTKAFDNDPKRWRMVAAIALDGATMLEILSPLCHHSLVLPVASIANIGKNIGFLTASASRAALHQSMAITGNLGDVTVKAGSQSMMASLAGTSLGIGLSTLLNHDTLNFGICFLCLSAIHQGCTYLSLQQVPLAHFNRHRLTLAIDYYLDNQTIPSPVDIGKIERFYPFVSSDSSSEWLHVGRPLRNVCQNPTELENCLASIANESYLIQFNSKTRDVDLIFFNDAKEQDLCRGIYHACLLRYKMSHISVGSVLTTTLISEVCANETTNRELSVRGIPAEKFNRQTHTQVQQNFPHFIEQLQTQGWNTSSGVTDVEDINAHRIQINIL